VATKRVLLVDDEVLIRYTLAHTLRRDGVEIVAVSSAEEALRALETQAFDLCFLDVRLPGMGGLEAFRVIRRRRPQTRIVLMSGHACAGHDLGEEDRPLQFLEKPFDLGLVRDLAESVLGAATDDGG